MYVFVSWAFVTTAAMAEEKRAAWVNSLTEKDAEGNAELIEKLTAKRCLPEYTALQQLTQGEPVEADSLNGNLLSVRLVIPSMKKIINYQLPQRMPGGGKLPVSLACRAFLLNTFKGEWTGDRTSPGNKRLMFVGLEGLSGFLAELAAACAALREPLPIDLWREQDVIELPQDKRLMTLIDACAYNQERETGQTNYQKLILGWMGSGASAERDSSIALSTGFHLGLKGT
jgi:hypothetical protein